MCIRELEQQFTFMSHIYSITFILYILTTHYKHTLLITDTERCSDVSMTFYKKCNITKRPEVLRCQSNCYF